MLDETKLKFPWEDEPSEEEFRRMIYDLKVHLITHCKLETIDPDSLELQKPDWTKPWSQLSTPEKVTDISYNAARQYMHNVFMHPEILALPWSLRLRSALTDQWLTPPEQRPQ